MNTISHEGRDFDFTKDINFRISIDPVTKNAAIEAFFTFHTGLKIRVFFDQKEIDKINELAKELPKT